MGSQRDTGEDRRLLSVAQLNILSADIYSRGDNLVLDIFRVCTPSSSAVDPTKEIAQVGSF